MKRIRTAMAMIAALVLLCGVLALPAAAIDKEAYAAEVLRLVNAEREKAGLAALTGGPDSLDAAANLRAQEIALRFSHTRPDGSDCFTALAEHGVTYAACGENIAFGYATPAQVVTGWMNSPGHKANILGHFNRLGVGVYEKNGSVHWAQMFILERGGTSGSPAVTTTRAVTGTTAASRATAARITTTAKSAAAGGSPGKSTAAMPAWMEWVLRVLLFGWIWMD